VEDRVRALSTEEELLITILRPYPQIDFSKFFQEFYRLKNLIEPRNHKVTESNDLDDDRLEEEPESWLKEALEENYHEPIALERRQLRKILPRWDQTEDGN
jgi:hypothetical protein